MSIPPSLYQETRISPTPCSPSSILHINAAGNASTAVGRKRAFDEISGLDEESYARKHLATEGSVFFRAADRAPRTFLWRVLNEGQLLEVQCVDLVQSSSAKGASDSWLTFHITLPAPIIPGGVVLADAKEKDALELFVVTSVGGKSELYTITLRRDLLLRETVPADFDSKTCVRAFTPSRFNYSKPYRIIATSNLELFISLHDGGLVRLQRAASESGSQWSETTFSEGGWLDYLPFRSVPTVDYHGGKVSANAIAAMVMSPDGVFVWTASLDHTLKAWDTRTGKVVLETDLLGENLSVEEKKRQANSPMGAEQGTLLQIGPPAMDPGLFDYSLIAHSPKDHQFKVYGIKSAASENGDIPQFLDMQPGKKLIPPIDELLNTNIWHLEQFYVIAGPDWEGSQLWLRARSGAVCRTFMMTFDLLDGKGNPKDLSEHFALGWSVVDSSSLTTDKLRQLPDFQGLEAVTDSTTTPSEKWLEFLFFPGRYSPASLETALYIYRKGRNLPATSAKGLKTSEEPLKERITSAVSAKILLRRLPNEQPDYDRYQLDLQAQWVTFFSLLSHLHNRRHESIGSAFDAEHGLAWTVCADFVAPVRASSKYDLLSHNAELCMNGDMEKLDQSIDETIWRSTDDVSRTQILAVAKQFRSCLSPAAQENLRSAATVSALDRSDDTPTEESLQLLYDRCGFVNEVSDEDFEALELAASQFHGLGTLTDDSFLAVLEVLDQAPEPHGPHANLTLGRYGKDVNIAIAKESIQQMQAALLDVLALIVFMAYELDENDLSSDFRPKDMYEAFILRISVTELRLWLVRNVRQEPMRASAKHTEMISMSIYESLFAGDWTVIARRKSQSESLSSLLTSWALHWTFGIDLSKQWSEITTWAMADLLRHKEVDLAADFAKFLPENETAWATYLKARLHLALGEYAQASLAFTDAAHDMSNVQNANSTLKGELLTPEDLLLIGKGPSPYFQHVLALFEKLKIYSYTADFASLALQYLPSRRDIVRHFEDLDMRKSKTDSPAIETVRNSGQEIKLMQQQQTRDDILGRLFTALVQTGRFEHAYATLTEMMDPMVKRSNLRLLVKACTKRNDPTGASVLLSLGIEGDLLKYADSVLLELAREAMSKSPAITSSAAPAYHQILFSFRTSNGDFRGAAAILHEHLERLRNSKGAMAQIIQDPEDETLVKVYALLINTLACCGEQEAWLLADPIEGVHPEGRKRKLVRLEDVRREYMAELDRRNDLAMGRFAIVGGGGDDDDDMVF